MVELNNNPLFQELKSLIKDIDYSMMRLCGDPDNVMSSHNFLAGRKSIFDQVESWANYKDDIEE